MKHLRKFRVGAFFFFAHKVAHTILFPVIDVVLTTFTARISPVEYWTGHSYINLAFGNSTVSKSP